MNLYPPAQNKILSVKFSWWQQRRIKPTPYSWDLPYFLFGTPMILFHYTLNTNPATLADTLYYHVHFIRKEGSFSEDVRRTDEPVGSRTKTQALVSQLQD